MRVRYFPHTYISDDFAHLLSRLFDEVAVTVASDEDPLPSEVTTLGPSPETAKRLIPFLAEWRQFSGLHQEGLSNYASQVGRRVDPVDEFLTTQIKSELMRKVAGHVPEDRRDDAFLKARAFLSLAVEYDMRCDDLNRDLARIDEMQGAFLGALKGELPPSPQPPHADDASGEIKMLERLVAWSTLFVEEGGTSHDRVFVTESREAIDLLEEYGCPLEALDLFSGHRFSRESLKKWLEGSPLDPVERSADDGVCDAVTARIFIIRREHPYNLFNEFIQGVRRTSFGFSREVAEIEGNILFVLIEGVAPR